jgi:hypothetical protein
LRADLQRLGAGEPRNPVPVNHNEPVIFDDSSDAARCDATNIPNLLSG